MTLYEFLARCLAARKMGLIKDKRGIQLPDEIWMQAIPEAEFIIGAIKQYELLEIVQRFHEDEGDE
jgi:hypothetical protein